jgi:molybdenum cofactor guanylyltransferase
MSFAAALLCGGRSTRMGRDKAWIDWEGMPLWRYQMQKLRELAPQRLILSCRKEQQIITEAECLDDPPGADDGPLGAITRCLTEVQMRLLVLAVDMPWMPVSYLREQILPGGFSRSEHGLEVLCAVYEPEMLPEMQKALQERRLSLQRVIEKCSPITREIPAEDKMLFRNANEPGDLRPERRS